MSSGPVSLLPFVGPSEGALVGFTPEGATAAVGASFVGSASPPLLTDSEDSSRLLPGLLNLVTLVAEEVRTVAVGNGTASLSFEQLGSIQEVLEDHRAPSRDHIRELWR